MLVVFEKGDQGKVINVMAHVLRDRVCAFGKAVPRDWNIYGTRSVDGDRSFRRVHEKQLNLGCRKRMKNERWKKKGKD